MIEPQLGFSAVRILYRNKTSRVSPRVMTGKNFDFSTVISKTFKGTITLSPSQTNFITEQLCYLSQATST
jgi:hypothetical protein